MRTAYSDDEKRPMNFPACDMFYSPQQVVLNVTTLIAQTYTWG